MKKMSRKTLFGVISVLFLFSLSHAIEKKEPATGIRTDEVPSASRVLNCPDLEAKLTLTKTKDGFAGTINLNGQVCNVGRADYISPPLAPAQATLAGYDPLKPLTGENYKVISGKAINNLPKGSCTPIVGIYTISGVAEWGHTSTPDVYPAQREFSLSIGRNVPDDVNFRLNEDCNKANNLAKEGVKYMTFPTIAPHRF
jgi:hypothetical protein